MWPREKRRNTEGWLGEKIRSYSIYYIYYLSSICMYNIYIHTHIYIYMYINVCVCTESLRGRKLCERKAVFQNTMTRNVTE